MFEKFRKKGAWFLFVLGYTALWLSFFLKHTRGLLYGGDLALFLVLILLWPEVKEKILSQRKLLILLGIFVLALLAAVIYSPYPSASLDGFLLNYFFHVMIFLLFMSGFYRERKFFWAFWMIPVLVSLAINIYYLGFITHKCHLKGICWLTGGMNFMDLSILRGLVPCAPIYVFLVFLFFMFSQIFKGNIKYFFLFLTCLNFGFIFWLGRRAALLGILFGAGIVAWGYPSRKVFRICVASLLVFVFLILFLISTPIGRRLLVRSENIKLLLSGKHEKFAKAGSLGIRLYVWPKYVKEILKHPFKGTGLTQRMQKRVLLERNIPLIIGDPHNFFISLSLRAGVQTLILFLIFYGWTFKRAYALVRKRDPVGIAMLGFLVAFLVMSFFDSTEKNTKFTPFWLASGLIWDRASRESSALPG